MPEFKNLFGTIYADKHGGNGPNTTKGVPKPGTNGGGRPH